MKLFLSYASEQSDLARYVYQALLQEGHEVFFDEAELRAGRGYHAKIRKEVQQSDGFVFLISPASLAHGCYTLTELSYAKKQWKDPTEHVLPVMVEHVEMNEVPAYLRIVSVMTPEGNVAAEVAAAVADWHAPEASAAEIRKAAELPFYISWTATKLAGQQRDMYLRIALTGGAVALGMGVLALAQVLLHASQLETIISAGGGVLTSLAAIPARGILPARTKLRALEFLREGFESCSPESDLMNRLVDSFHRLYDQELGAV